MPSRFRLPRGDWACLVEHIRQVPIDGRTSRPRGGRSWCVEAERRACLRAWRARARRTRLGAFRPLACLFGRPSDERTASRLQPHRGGSRVDVQGNGSRGELNADHLSRIGHRRCPGTSCGLRVRALDGASAARHVSGTRHLDAPSDVPGDVGDATGVAGLPRRDGTWLGVAGGGVGSRSGGDRSDLPDDDAGIRLTAGVVADGPEGHQTGDGGCRWGRFGAGGFRGCRQPGRRRQRRSFIRLANRRRGGDTWVRGGVVGGRQAPPVDQSRRERCGAAGSVVCPIVSVILGAAILQETLQRPTTPRHLGWTTLEATVHR